MIMDGVPMYIIVVEREMAVRDCSEPVRTKQMHLKSQGFSNPKVSYNLRQLGSEPLDALKLALHRV
jgi:hypothetical protein